MNTEHKVFDSGNSVLVRDVRILNPALDCNPNETLLLAVPLPGVRIVQTKKGEEKRPDMILCVVASRTFNNDTKAWEERPELFEATIAEFTKRGWFARVPVTDLVQRWEAHKIQQFLDGEAPKVNACEIFKRILAKWRFYIDFDKNPRSDTFSALWTMGSYFFFLFNYFPYLKWGGTKGVGKSKAGVVGRGMCFNAEIFSGATESAIFRLASDTRGTQIIDEQEQLNDEEANAYVQILNSGFQADGAAIRTNKDSMRVERWPSFSPKMICAILGLRETLEDRAIEIVIYMSGNAEIKGREPPTSDAEEWKSLRNDLYLLLFQEWQTVRKAYLSIENSWGFQSRLWNISKPIFAIADLIDQGSSGGTPKVKDELVAFLQDVQKSKQAAAISTNSAMVVYAVRRVLDETKKLDPTAEDYRYAIAISDVVDNGAREEGEWFREAFKPKTVAGLLKNLHLYNNPQRKKGGYAFEVSVADVRETMKRYGMPEPTEELKG